MFSIVKTLDQDTVSELLSIAKTASMRPDVSSYARGRMRTWLNIHWDLKERKFSRSSDCFANDRLWAIMKDIWPQADIGLLTYSGIENPKGIALHRDDSYADYESYGIHLSGTCEFIYMGGYRNFFWENQQDPEVRQSHQLKPGDVFRFNCKNRHSAVPGPERYAINLWKIAPKFRKDYDSINKTTALF